MVYKNPDDMRAYQREWVRRKRAGKLTAHKPQVVNSNARPTKRAYVEGLKSTTPCKACGIYDEPCAMDYHHIDQTIKKFEIGAAVRGAAGKVPLDLLKEEIEKCYLLCAPCHRKVHKDLLCIIGGDQVFDRMLSL